MRDRQGNGAGTTVLIVGAGPTGLTLACELARRGISFRLVEASPGPQPGSRGKGLQPRTLEVFDDLGIVERVMANGQSLPFRATAADGTVKLMGGEPLPRRPDVPYPASLITPEWRIEEALRLRLAELGGRVEFGAVLESFEQTEELVAAEICKGGQRELVSSRWLVGCDGGHSTVRKQAGIAFSGETREEVRMIVADVAVRSLDRDAWHMWSHEEGMVSLCPLPSTDVFQFQASVAPGQDQELSVVNMQGLLRRRSGRTDLHLGEPEWTSLWRANIRLVDRYRKGRVLLAGDAAHIHSPAGGQGMNTGIQDAYNLGWKLAAVARGVADPALLDTYEGERRPVAIGVLALSNARLKEAIEGKAIPTRRDASTMQLGIGYRESPLARDDRDETARLRAGDRAPDATALKTVEGERRLFDLLRGEQFTLLNFGPGIRIGAFPIDVSSYKIVADLAEPHDVVDTEGHLAQAYGATGSTLVLIRPDGYIAVISDAGKAAAIEDYLAALAGSREVTRV